MNEAQALLSPLLEVPFVVGRFLGQGIGPVLDDSQASGRGEVDGLTCHGDGRNPLVRKPTTARKIVKLPTHLANRAAGCANPQIIGKPGSQTESVLERKPLLTANRGHGHPSQHSQPTIGGHHQGRPMAQRIASGLGWNGAPVPAQIRRPSVSVFASKTATAVGTDSPRSHDVNQVLVGYQTLDFKAGLSFGKGFERVALDAQQSGSHRGENLSAELLDVADGRRANLPPEARLPHPEPWNTDGPDLVPRHHQSLDGLGHPRVEFPMAIL